MNKVNQTDLINWWLEKFHNTNLDKVIEDNSEWKDNPSDHTREFYKKYAVTTSQYVEWQNWAKNYVKQITKYSNREINKSWWVVELNCAPSIIEDEDE